MSADAQRDAQLLRRLAGVCALLVLVVVAASAYLRLTQAGFSCADWPACFGKVVANQEATALEASVFWTRVAHRLAAMGVTLMALAILVLAYRLRGDDSRPMRLAVAALVLTLFLALLGRWTTGSRIPAVTLGNLLGGFALLAVLWRLHLNAVPAAGGGGQARALVAGVGLLLALQVALGGLVSASFAGLSCTGFPGCGPTGFVFDLALFNPFRVVELDAEGVVLRPAGLSGLVAAHRLIALALALSLLALVLRLWRQRAGQQALALRLLALLGLAYGLGIASALSAPPLALVFGHNVVAALLVLSLAEVR